MALLVNVERKVRRITTIVGVEKKFKSKKPYFITHALLDHQDEALGYGKDFKVGDLVEYFYHAKWDKAKMVRPKVKR